jgi:NAD(P)H-dependent FMN reductase
MTDIVERLRAYNTSELDTSDDAAREHANLIDEAADEIMRLRDDLTMARADWNNTADEVKRLRAAVQRIDGINDNPAIYNPDIEAVVSTIYKRAGK